jgi:2-methylcitrate dehydratase PrpD
MSSAPVPAGHGAPARPDLVVDLARFASAIDVASLDRAVVDAVKVNILDTMACALAGSSANGIAEVAGLAREWGGAPQADLWVLGGKLPAPLAAWVNGGMSHARDYDDTHDAAVLHAGVTTVPAAIAAGQLLGKLSGADLIASVAAGLEVVCRLGVAKRCGIVDTGFIFTPLLGYFGATAAAGRALGLTQEQMVNALGIVYSHVAGNHQVTRDASLMKRLQVGLSAQAGVVAAQMAQRGIRGARNVFEGVDGFFRVYLGNRVEPEVARRDLGQRFELMNLSYKPYPCCRANHAPVDAALKARAQAPRPAQDIEVIRVGVNAQGYQIVCTPEQVRRAPKTNVEAQFSIPFTVSSAWIDGRLGLGNFTEEGLRRADVLALAARVQPCVDDAIEKGWSTVVTPARLTVEFRDGSTAEAWVDRAKGHPDNPMSEADFLAKATDCARFAARPMPADTAERLTSTVGRLESLPEIADLVRILA